MLRCSPFAWLLASLMLVGTARAQELVPNPLYASWARYEPGAAVVIEVKTSSQGQTVKTTITQTLVQVTADDVLLESKSKIQAQGQTQETEPQAMTVSAKVAKEQAEVVDIHPDATGSCTEVGTDTLLIDGKEYRCKVSDYSGAIKGTKMEGKIWRADDAPGRVVRAEILVGEGAGFMAMKVISVTLK